MTKFSKWTYERAYELSLEKGITLISEPNLLKEYNHKTKLIWKCGCNKEIFERSIIHVSVGQVKCKSCVKGVQGKKKKLDIYIARSFIEAEGYTLNSTHYENSHSKLSITCNNGHQFDMALSAFKQGQRCPKCRAETLSKRYSKGIEKYSEELCIAHSGTIAIVGDYTNQATKTLHRCNLCNTEWDAYPVNMLRGTGCPTCGMSKGERRIKAYLDIQGIEYETEKKFKGLYSDNGFPLRFDFALIRDGNIFMLIEYDGEFHFTKRYPTQTFDLQLKYDSLKNEFVEREGILLLRIPYTQFDKIEEILKEHIL